jgi:hypothetical protein
VTAPGNRGNFGRMKAINAKRLALVDRLDDPFELGDIYSMNAWCDAFVGNLRVARQHAERGVSVAGDSPTVVGCLSWLAFTAFCLGDWTTVMDHVQPELERRLGDRADSPPHFSVPAFGAAAFIAGARSAPTAARYLDILRAWLGTTQGYSAGMVDAWLAMILSHHGAVDEARAVIDAIPPNVRFAVTRPFIDAAAARVLAASSSWDAAARFLGPTRAYADHAQLIALPAHLDRLDGLMTAATGNADRALELLMRARTTFATMGDRWNAAVVDLDLAGAFHAAGDTESGALHCDEAETVFADLRSIRDLERVRTTRAEVRGTPETS